MNGRPYLNIKNALVGYSGFVGSTLVKQFNFDDLYRSTNISEIQDKTYDTVVCAGAPAVKWLANKEPLQDKQSIDSLISYLSTIKCKRFILISTVDVFKESLFAVESTPVNTSNLHPYGFHRYQLEEFVKTHFDDFLIVRLPGLVGPGLKKNVIYDFLNNNNLDAIDHRGIFQFYPMVNLWSDIEIAINNSCKLIHLTSEPISVKEIASSCFNIDFVNELDSQVATYDFRSEFSDLYNSDNAYQYSKKEVQLAIRNYAQSELKKECSL
jgi:nucleoside-diphosphate-sugar epimerase